MDWQAALRARLLADAPLTALVGTRIHWVERKQRDPLPGVTLLTVSDGKEQHLKGFQGYQASRVQIDAWAENHKQAFEVTGAVISAAVPPDAGNGHIFSRAMVEIPPRDMVDRPGDNLSTKTIFRVSMDLIFHHATAEEEGS